MLVHVYEDMEAKPLLLPIRHQELCVEISLLTSFLHLSIPCGSGDALHHESIDGSAEYLILVGDDQVVHSRLCVHLDQGSLGTRTSLSWVLVG